MFFPRPGTLAGLHREDWSYSASPWTPRQSPSTMVIPDSTCSASTGQCDHTKTYTAKRGAGRAREPGRKRWKGERNLSTYGVRRAGHSVLRSTTAPRKGPPRRPPRPSGPHGSLYVSAFPGVRDVPPWERPPSLGQPIPVHDLSRGNLRPLIRKPQRGEPSYL
jgi:hypothetical protein